MTLPTLDELKTSKSWEIEPLVRNGLRLLLDRRVAGDLGIDEIWKRALVSETNYWNRVLTGEHARDSEAFFARLEGYADQPFEFAAQAASNGARTCRVLDVGAGPFTVVGRKHDALEVEITAIDPLADHYNAALEEHGVTPPVRTVPAEGERLDEHFAPDSFDLVHSLNALDHAWDPMLCIHKMVEVCRPGGSIILRGGENTALLNVYGGLHQWNFMPVDSDLVIWRPDRKLSVRQALGDAAEVRAVNDGPERYFVEIRVASRKAAAAPTSRVDYADLYDDVYAGNPHYTNAATSPGLRTAMMNAQDILSAGPRHLDVGAGPGYLVEALSQAPFRKRSVGLEISPRAVGFARERLGEGRVHLIERADAWPFDDESFDLVTCFDVLEHLEPEDIDVMLAEIRRVGAPAGRLLLNISLRDSASRDKAGDTLHRTVRPVGWWMERIDFERFAVTTREAELYGVVAL